MEITNVILRKKLFGSLKGAWSRPISVSEFIHKYSDEEERERLIKDRESIKFVTVDAEILDYAEGLKGYRISERRYLDSFLNATFNQLGSLSLS